MEVVGVISHAQHLGHDGVLSPLGSELLYQLHQVTGGRLTDSVHLKMKQSHCIRNGSRTAMEPEQNLNWKLKYCKK